MACYSKLARAGAFLLCFNTFVSCGASLPRPMVAGDQRESHQVAQQLGPCPHGFDYGSGIVALEFPPAVHDAFAAVRELIAERHATLLLPADDPVPYAPHVSLVYGVLSGNRGRIVDYLEKRKPELTSVEIRAQNLAFWDNGNNDKTIMVTTLCDGDQSMERLHNDLQGIMQQASRYPFTPHITLAQFRRGTRLEAADLEILEKRLALVRGKASVLMVTDRCGLPTGYIGLQERALQDGLARSVLATYVVERSEQ